MCDDEERPGAAYTGRLRQSRARSRWAKLAGALLSGRVTLTQDARLELFCVVSDDSGLLQSYEVSAGRSILIRTAGVEHVSVNHSHLEGFDNTGNIRIWPSEEVLAFYCAERCEQFAQKRVLELAAGMSGLAGLVVAALGEPSRVVITDGNEQSSKHLAENVKLNTHLSPKVPIESGCLLWGKERRRVHERLGRFDVVIAADCLFLTEYHQHLLESLDLLLDAGGYALLVGPTRGGSQGLFVERARSHGPFEVELHAEIHPRVRTLVQQQLHACVDPEERDTMNDKLTPRLVVIRRRNNHDASH